ncbi:MAG: helix-turn-helix domain-containing protein [Lyngbya sp. HA4199-MV5]|jgi:hypothetical protein|nr:helix-turn-helix domain-containing protein [Lyngbya sp. HA4199-MV5]
MKTHYERERIIWDAALSPTEKLFLLCLNSFVDSKGECFPGKETISQMCGVDVRTVTRIAQRLIEAGVLSKDSRRLGSRQQSNLYRIRFSAIPQSAQKPQIEAVDFQQDIASKTQQDNLSPSINSQQDIRSTSAGHSIHFSRTLCHPIYPLIYPLIYPERKESAPPRLNDRNPNQ